VVFQTEARRPVVLNHVPFNELQFIPRVGESVLLPVPTDGGVESVSAVVQRIEYGFFPAGPSDDFPERDAALSRVIVYVRKR
jgi:hypothetical protein